jgi:hypothetical protein
MLAGIAELATQAEVDAGTDDKRIVTPAKLKTVISRYYEMWVILYCPINLYFTYILHMNDRFI